MLEDQDGRHSHAQAMCNFFISFFIKKHLLALILADILYMD